MVLAKRFSLALLLLAVAAPLAAQPRGDFDDLLKGDLSQWESAGDGIWHLTPDGILVGRRAIDRGSAAVVDADGFGAWVSSQAWLYTKKEFGEFDLHLDFFVGWPGNSGVSIRDVDRAKHAVTIPHDETKTPARTAYEIQISAGEGGAWPTGSIYGLAKAKEGVQEVDEWNSLNIESRKDGIRVLVNGVPVAEHESVPGRSLTGPIGLQLHDRGSVVMFRDVWLMER